MDCQSFSVLQPFCWQIGSSVPATMPTTQETEKALADYQEAELSQLEDPRVIELGFASGAIGANDFQYYFEFFLSATTVAEHSRMCACHLCSFLAFIEVFPIWGLSAIPFQCATSQGDLWHFSGPRRNSRNDWKKLQRRGNTFKLLRSARGRVNLLPWDVEPWGGSFACRTNFDAVRQL